MSRPPHPADPGDGMPSLSDLRARIGDLGAFVGSVGRLLRGLLTDPRVPGSAKLVVVAGTGYALSPIDLVPDLVLPFGLLDDLWIARQSLRYLIRRTGRDVVREHWDGTEEGFDTLLLIAGISR